MIGLGSDKNQLNRISNSKQVSNSVVNKILCPYLQTIICCITLVGRLNNTCKEEKAEDECCSNRADTMDTSYTLSTSTANKFISSLWKHFSPLSHNARHPSLEPEQQLAPWPTSMHHHQYHLTHVLINTTWWNIQGCCIHALFPTGSPSLRFVFPTFVRPTRSNVPRTSHRSTSTRKSSMLQVKYFVHRRIMWMRLKDDI